MTEEDGAWVRASAKAALLRDADPEYLRLVASAAQRGGRPGEVDSVLDAYNEGKPSTAEPTVARMVEGGQ
jgi:hypothetical protein